MDNLCSFLIEALPWMVLKPMIAYVHKRLISNYFELEALYLNPKASVVPQPGTTLSSNLVCSNCCNMFLCGVTSHIR